jgi:hypothetical protein
MLRLGALIVAAAATGAVALPAHASTLTYDITLTQTYGTLITTSDFTVTGSFTVPAPTSNYQSENISNLSFAIGGKNYISDATIQFQGSGPTINAIYGYSDTVSGDTLSSISLTSFQLYGTGISSTIGGTVNIALAPLTPPSSASTTPLPGTLPLFAGALGAITAFMKWRRKRHSFALQN